MAFFINKYSNWYIRVMMLLSAGANTITVTLNEKISLATPEFVLILINETTRQKVACKLGSELSEYPDRANQFLVTVQANPTATSSQILPANYGRHRYLIYEMVDADTFNFAAVDTLDIRTLSGLVEQGLCEYVRPEVELENYKDVKASIKAYK